MSNYICWFSGTGNSLYAAKLLAESLPGALLVSMSTPPTDLEPMGGSGSSIGFVFPSYYGDLPRIVRAFVEKLTILPGADVFVLVTMGALGQGAVKAMADLLAEKGQSLRYGTGVRMLANYIISYDPALFGAAADRRVHAQLDRAGKKIKRIAGDIAAGKQTITTNRLTAKTLYENIPALDANFAATNACTGCGLCSKICPVQNIVPVDGKPHWLHHCEHCVACISWCPAEAIQYGQKTARRTRYRNPRIDRAELM